MYERVHIDFFTFFKAKRFRCLRLSSVLGTRSI